MITAPIKCNEEGKCPYCNEYSLEYGCLDIADGDMICYPWKCDKCERQGEEWYSLKFAGHNVKDDDGVEYEITEDMIEQEVK